ncbi:heme peroxidase [Ancylostoma caninum]|uniref:Heme peroxidase n=1 Tax=Ancylostoma caninum TaxID=29170 RepID=A0A368FXX4_ANCCA|nr:heme peroxidase [Ancylostoma caninum]
MRWLCLLLMMVSPLWTLKFPCGPSFVPCEKKAFGVRNVGEGSTKQDLFFTDKRVELRKEVSKLMGHDQILLAARQAKDDIERLFNQTEKQLQRTTTETSFSSGELSWAHYTRGDRYSKFLSYSALISIRATQKLSRSSSSSRVFEGFPFVSLDGSVIQSHCPASQIEECIAGKYRTYSGHCNNVNHPQYGAIYEPLRRLLAPDYEDKISSPRTSKSGAPLPPATEVASLFTPAPRGHATCSMILAQWASFIYDDLAHVASNRLVKEGFFTTSKHLPLPCCDPAVDHPECFPIRGRDGKCVTYSRSMPTPTENCTLGPRQQGNMVSGYLDASQIYGSTQEIADKLRSFKDGLLLLRTLSASHGGLPQPDDDEECKRISANAEQCFLSGSQRINFLPSNAVMYTMWMRQHNFVAGKLKVNDKYLKKSHFDIFVEGMAAARTQTPSYIL